MIIIAVLQSLGILSFCSKNTAFYYQCFATESYLYSSTFATLVNIVILDMIFEHFIGIFMTLK